MKYLNSPFREWINWISKSDQAYWMNMNDPFKSKLKDVISKFNENTPLKTDELYCLKAYILRWINHLQESRKLLDPSFKPKKLILEYGFEIQDLSQKELNDYIVSELLSEGIDPL